MIRSQSTYMYKSPGATTLKSILSRYTSTALAASASLITHCIGVTDMTSASSSSASSTQIVINCVQCTGRFIYRRHATKVVSVKLFLGV